MADVTIDTSAEDGLYSAENAELTWIRITGCGVLLETSWEQAESIYLALKPFFDEADVAKDGAE